MYKVSVVLLGILVVLGCSGKQGENVSSPKTTTTSEKPPKTTEKLKLEWGLVTSENSDGYRRTAVGLMVNGTRFELDEPGLGIAPLEKDDYSTYDIPDSALLAAGGWFAGQGAYYYVIREGGTLVVMTGYDDEENEEGLRYKEQKRIPISALPE